MDGISIVGIVENIGVAGLVFAIWYIYHRSQVKQQKHQMESFLSTMKDATTSQKDLNEIQFNTFRQAIEKTIELQDDESKRMFELVKDMTETEQYQSAIMARIEGKINNLDLYKIIKDITQELRGNK